MQKPQMDTSDTAFIYAGIRNIDWQHACTIPNQFVDDLNAKEKKKKKMIKQDDIRFFFQDNLNVFMFAEREQKPYPLRIDAPRYKSC